MHGPESSPGRQSGGGSLGVSPLWHAASMRPSLSLVLHGSFPNADPDVVPPMSGVIFEKEQSLCPERPSTILDFPDCSCHRAFNSSLPMLVGHRDPRSSFLEPQLSDHQPRAPTCDSGTLFPLWLPATMTAPPPRTEGRLFVHIYSPNVW